MENLPFNKKNPAAKAASEGVTSAPTGWGQGIVRSENNRTQRSKQVNRQHTIQDALD